MKRRGFLCLASAMAVVCSLSAQTNGSDPFVGVWRGQFEILPAVTLTVTDEGGGLSGAVLFYLIKRSSSMTEPTTATPGAPEPLLKLKRNGDVLEFEVSHRRAHPPRTLSDPPARFRLKLNGPDTAELVNETEPSSPAVVMHRDKQE